jgi:hypothetical protein
MSSGVLGLSFWGGDALPAAASATCGHHGRRPHSDGAAAVRPRAPLSGLSHWKDAHSPLGLRRRTSGPCRSCQTSLSGGFGGRFRHAADAEHSAPRASHEEKSENNCPPEPQEGAHQSERSIPACIFFWLGRERASRSFGPTCIYRESRAGAAEALAPVLAGFRRAFMLTFGAGSSPEPRHFSWR